MADEKDDSPWVLVGGMGLTLAGLLVEFFTVGVFLKAREIANWPTTPGKILKSEVESSFRDHKAIIEYEYRIEEKTYKSIKVRPRGSGGRKYSDAERDVRAYPVGKEVTVYYNRSDPADTALEAEPDFGSYVMIISPLFFAGFGVFLIVKFFLEKSRPVEKKRPKPGNQPLRRRGPPTRRPRREE